jgi:hypothetical protein
VLADELFRFRPRTLRGTPAMDTKLSWLGMAKVPPEAVVVTAGKLLLLLLLLRSWRKMGRVSRFLKIEENL